MNFDTSMQQGGESAVEGTTYAVQFCENSKCGPQAPAVIPSKSIWNVFFPMTITLLISWLVALTCQEPNRTVGTILV